jgi:hypothetical protein
MVQTLLSHVSASTPDAFRPAHDDTGRRYVALRIPKQLWRSGARSQAVKIYFSGVNPLKPALTSFAHGSPYLDEPRLALNSNQFEGLSSGAFLVNLDRVLCRPAGSLSASIFQNRI